MRVGEWFVVKIYLMIVWALPQALILWMVRRKSTSNSDWVNLERAVERVGVGMAARPDGPAIWLHSIGPGDSTALLPLIAAIQKKDKTIVCIITTRTASAQKVFGTFGERSRVIVQLAPVDTPAAMQRFLDHWRPSAAIFCEADIWPNAAMMLKRRDIPIALVNAQMNGRFGGMFRKLPGIGRWLMSHVDYLHVFTAKDAAEARNWVQSNCVISVQPNLKMDAPALSVRPEVIQDIKEQFGTSPILTCVSVANNEVKTLLESHRLMQVALPDLRLILVPRWIEQGAEMQKIVAQFGVSFSRRSIDGRPNQTDSVFIADTYREMGNWIEISFAVFMGHTLEGGSGHNPYEPVSQQRMIISGSIPNLLQADYQYLTDLKLCTVSRTSDEIAESGLELWKNRQHNKDIFSHFVRDQGFTNNMLDEILALLY